MKTLTALTLLIALPNVFYGMYGMNIGLPYQEYPLAYPIIIASSLVAVFCVIMAETRVIVMVGNSFVIALRQFD